MGDHEDESLALRANLERLPQELHDEIYNLTFTFTPTVHILTSSAIKCLPETLELASKQHSEHPAHTTLNKPFPHLFHVDRASRNKNAISYYRFSVFLAYGFAAAQKLKTVDPAHCGLIMKVRFLNVAGEDATDPCKADFTWIFPTRLHKVIVDKMVFTGARQINDLLAEIEN